MFRIGKLCALLLALDTASTDYSAKIDVGNAAEQTLFSLGWKLEELKKVNEDGPRLLAEVSVIQDIIEDHNSDFVAKNVARHLTDCWLKATTFHSRKLHSIDE